jgi:CBS domain-containing protein
MRPVNTLEARHMLKAKAIMTTDVVAVTRDMDIYAAIQTMIAHNVTGLPVIDSERTLVGVVTEKDVLTLLYNIEDRPGKVQDYMTPVVVAFDQEDSIVAIAESLGDNPFRRVPILKDGKLVGVVSRKDIVRHMKKQRARQKMPA